MPEGKTEPPKMDKSRIYSILEILESMYPNAQCALNYANPFQLLIATMLSAQCTDARVNTVTERLFRKFTTPTHFASLTPGELEPEIRELGLFRIKARNIIAASRSIVDNHDGQVPRDPPALRALPGVGRKTANVVLSNAFGVPALAVDTHVFRVAHRLGLSTGRTPEHTENDLIRLIPRDLWSRAHHWLIHHGRQICTARNPGCTQCPLLAHCPTGLSAPVQRDAPKTKSPPREQGRAHEQTPR